MNGDCEDIFLSYQAGNRAQAATVMKALVGVGWSVYWDRETPIGMDWEQVLEIKLAGAKCVVVLWSKKSVRSRWVKIEADEADERGILIPAVIDDNPRLPLAYKRRQNAMLADWDGNPKKPEFELLIKAIGGLIGFPEGSRRKLRTVRKSNRRILERAIKARSFVKSSRSDQLYYLPSKPGYRVRLDETRVRLEKKTAKGWRVRASYRLEQPVDIFLKELVPLE